jgi:hypothetical protein
MDVVGHDHKPHAAGGNAPQLLIQHAENYSPGMIKA